MLIALKITLQYQNIIQLYKANEKLDTKVNFLFSNYFIELLLVLVESNLFNLSTYFTMKSNSY